MSRSTGSFLLVLGLVAAAALVFWTLEDSASDEGFDLADERAPNERGTPSDEPAPLPDAETRASKRTVARDGVPRVLPPDAAIEDVRDALALRAEDRRTRAVQEAYDAIVRLVTTDPDVRGLQRYVLRVEDPAVRAVVFAALGANRDAGNLGYLATRLQRSASALERTGAFLGLVYAKTGTVRCSAAMGGVTVGVGALPGSRSVLGIIAGWLDRETATSAADAIEPLALLVARDVDVAALLVVDDKRACKLYASLTSAARERMRSSALKHAALPGAVRRVLE